MDAARHSGEGSLERAGRGSNLLAKRLAEGGPLLADGAWGTLLQKAGLPPGACPELWCLERPELVEGIARDYLSAGAEAVATNSFGANRIKLSGFGLAERAGEINERAAALSRSAVDRFSRETGGQAFVIASMGPTGKLLVMDEVSPEEVHKAYAEQAQALERGGAEAAAVETMSDLEEARLALRAIRENTGLAAVLTFTFERTVRGDYRSMMGVSPSEVLSLAAEEGAVAVGANCGNGLERMIELIGEFRAAADALGGASGGGAAGSLPLAARANAGMPILVDGRTVFPESPGDMALRLPALVRAGARLIGGCCGTGPEHIRALSAALAALGRA